MKVRVFDKQDNKLYYEYENVDKVNIRDVFGFHGYEGIESGIAAIICMSNGTATFDYVNWDFDINL